MKSSLASLPRQLLLILLFVAIFPLLTSGATALASEAAAHAADPHAVSAAPHAGAAEAHADAHGDAHSNPLSAEKLKDLFWRTVNFLALLIILVKFLGKPVMNALGSRQERIAGELAEKVFIDTA